MARKRQRKTITLEIPWQQWATIAVAVLVLSLAVWILIRGWQEAQAMSAEIARAWAYYATVFGLVLMTVAGGVGVYIGRIESKGRLWGLDRGTGTQAVGMLRAVVGAAREERHMARQPVAQPALSAPVMPVIHQIDSGPTVVEM